MTIQYSSDTKRAYEDFLKQYDADKSGVSDWTEYLTGLQQSVKDTSTEYQKSAYNDITQAYRNYFIQSSNLAGKGLASGLKQSLGQDLYSSYQGTKASVENTAANKITSLLENYSKTVGEAETAMSEKASTLTTLTEAALDWYEQVGKDKKVLDDKMQETGEYRYQDLIDLYNSGNGDLWQNVSSDVYNPSYTLSNLGHAVIDTALADENFAEYLKNYSDKEDLRDLYIENKGLLQEALGVDYKGERAANVENILKDSKTDERLKNNINVDLLKYASDDKIKDIVSNITVITPQDVKSDQGHGSFAWDGNIYITDSGATIVDKTDDVYKNYLIYLNKNENLDTYYHIGDDVYRYEKAGWVKLINTPDKKQADVFKYPQYNRGHYDIREIKERSKKGLPTKQ